LEEAIEEVIEDKERLNNETLEEILNSDEATKKKLLEAAANKAVDATDGTPVSNG